MKSRSYEIDYILIDNSEIIVARHERVWAHVVKVYGRKRGPFYYKWVVKIPSDLVAGSKITWSSIHHERFTKGRLNKKWQRLGRLLERDGLIVAVEGFVFRRFNK